MPNAGLKMLELKVLKLKIAFGEMPRLKIYKYKMSNSKMLICKMFEWQSLDGKY